MSSDTTLNDPKSLRLLPEKAKLTILQRKLKELENLIVGNEYESFFSQHLMSIQVEVNRQLSHYE